MPSWVRRLPVALTALLVAALAFGAFSSTAEAQPSRVPGPVVVVGMPGLTWQNVDPHTTPSLWRLAGVGASGSMTARVDARLTCPVESWLTVNAGSRARMPTPEERGQAPSPTPTPTAADDAPPQCPQYPKTTKSNGIRTVDDWQAYRTVNANGEYGTRLGTLPATLRRYHQCVGASGPGALLASATPDGVVTDHRGPISDLPSIVRDCPLTFVDAGLHASPQQADSTLADTMAALPPDATVLVLGMSDRYDYAQMHVAIAHGPSLGEHPFEGRWLGSASTRRDDIMQLTDVTPTLLQLLGHGHAQTSAMVGTPLRAGDRYDSDVADVVDRLRGIDYANKVTRDLTPAFNIVLEVGQLVIYIVAAIGLRRRWSTPVQRRRVLRVVQVTALAGASVPAASFLANLVPWWYTGHPLPALIGICIMFVAAIMALALGGPWRNHLIGPPTIVAGTTGAVLGVDVLTGSHMQLSGLLGYPVVIGARFYGFGNIMFALFATGVMIFLAGLYHWLQRYLHRSVALATVLLLGVFAVLLDGWPAWGSDFGGVIGFLPGIVVFAMLLSGHRLNVRWLVAILASGIVAVTVIAYLDYLRPADQRSHLGRFVAQVIDGDAGGVITRKLGANLSILISNYGLSLLVVIGVLFLAFVLMRPVEWHAAALQRVFEQVPSFRAALLALLVTLVISTFVNDSGIAIPAAGMMVAIPLAVAASARAVADDLAVEAAAGAAETADGAAHEDAPSESTN
ncbi:MAG: efflux RND transporter permease subunit [Streptosporangiales bacterium]|nr:efflux RND transporter permease subunit [Streptosporangiales bacterium]MBO0891071.1 efflux RND transporter permease subunit [Acidothermales bacterium]